MNRSIAVILCWCLYAQTITPSVLSDEFHLVQGGRVRGRLLNPEREARERYVVETAAGARLTLADKQVERVVSKSDIERRYEAKLAIIVDTEAAHLGMAEGCRKAGLEQQRLFHLSQVIRHNPDHEEARHALGYSRVDGRWLRRDQWMEEQGYVYHRGKWRLPQEITLKQAKDEYDLEIIEWRRKLKTWRSWIVKQRDNASTGEAEIRAVRDPGAAVALATMLANEKEHRYLKGLYVEVLGQIPGPDSAATLTKHALHDEDAKVREASLDQLERMTSPSSVATFVDALSDEKNYMVNRAAIALARMGDASATLPLIDALVTEHRHVITRGGGVTPTFSNQGGGLSAGSSREVKDVKQQNESVLHALTALHNGVNYGFNQTAWKNWYVTNHTPPPDSLRRGE